METLGPAPRCLYVAPVDQSMHVLLVQAEYENYESTLRRDRPGVTAVITLWYLSEP